MEERLKAQEREEERYRKESGEYQRDIEILSLAEQGEYRINNAIRRTDLEPGHELTALLFFPKDIDPRFLRFVLTVEDLPFEIFTNKNCTAA